MSGNNLDPAAWAALVELADITASPEQAAAHLHQILGAEPQALNAALQWQQLMPPGQHMGSVLQAVEEYQTQGFVSPPD